MQRFFHFTLTSDARRQIPKMILERLVEEYVWQGGEFRRGAPSIKSRVKRIQQEIEKEILRRKAHREFERLLSKMAINEHEKTG